MPIDRKNQQIISKSSIYLVKRHLVNQDHQNYRSKTPENLNSKISTKTIINFDYFT